ncbi:glycosyltransferase family 4 protein [Chloroflexota bacterium]
MRIAILVPNFVELDGGARVAELQVQDLAKEGNHVAVFSLNADIKPGNAALFVMGMPKSLFWRRVYRLLFPLDVPKTIRWLPKLKEFDLVVVHLYPMTWLGYLAKKLYKVKYIFWFHGIEEPWLFPHLYERVYIRMIIFFTRLTVRNVDQAISVSGFAKKKLKQYTGLDSEVVYNKIDLTHFHKGIDGSYIREQHNLRDCPIILTVGRLVPQKGLHLLIKAFHLVKDKIPEAKLMIVGDVSLEYYEKELRRISDNSVMFVGHVKSNNMPFYYAMCDVYATCSLWENHSLTVLEAQAMGKPVIAFSIEAFSEQVDSNGMLVEVGNTEQFAQVCIDKIREVRQGNRENMHNE